MKILQGGVPKCGNFWLWQIIQQILKLSDHDHTSYIEKQPIYNLARTWDLNFPEQARIDVIDITDLQVSHRISSIYRMPIENMPQYLAQTNHVWTHSPICKRSADVFKHFNKKVYIIRDPRDRAISASKYYTSLYMLKYFPQEEKDPQSFLNKNLEKLMHEWVWHVWDHLRMSKTHNIHFLFFEGLKTNFQQELQGLLDYLEIDLTKNQKLFIEDAVSFSTLKKQNPKHLKTGKFGYWKEHLNDTQLSTTLKIVNPLLNFLGYPEDDTPTTVPPLNATMQEIASLKEKLIYSQQFLYS
ncbi:sulfotransferase domain-containing protein [Cytophagaceae bacterium ABcell3]|nr:sulfotransferase domain-containing protein [Cytophagaceae bacterium ABcell3]